MENIILEELMKTLIEEYNCLVKIEAIEEEKNNLLVNGKLSDFSEINVELEKLIIENSKLEERRIVITDRILQFAKLPKETSLKELIPSIPDFARKKFEDIYDKFKSILARIKFLSSANSEMLKNTISILDISLSHATSDESDFNYAKKQNDKKTSTQSILINKLA